MRFRSRHALAALALAVAAAAAACGGGQETSTTGAGTGPVDGREVFLQSGCGDCHTFEPAGTEAELGPDLRWSTMTKPQVERRIREGSGPMPNYAYTLSPEQISAVADFLIAGRSA